MNGNFRTYENIYIPKIEFLVPRSICGGRILLVSANATIAWTHGTIMQVVIAYKKIPL